MIYGNNNSVRLYGKVADNFLESVGVSIFDDGDIAIGESIFDLSTACDILEENGVILCEDCIVLEGEQAEEYKARKAKEKADAKKAYDERNKPNKYQYGTTKGDKYPGYNNHSHKDIDRSLKADEMISRTRDRYFGDSKKHNKNVRDAIHRLEDLERNTPYDKRGNSAYQAEKKRYEDAVNKADKTHNQNMKTYDNDVYRSTMRYLKNQDRIARSKKSTVQHNSTIFSNVEII